VSYAVTGDTMQKEENLTVHSDGQ